MVQINLRGTKHLTAKGPSSLFEPYCTLLNVNNNNNRFFVNIINLKLKRTFKCNEIQLKSNEYRLDTDS